MSRMRTLVLATIAAGAMGYGIAHAAQVPRQATNTQTLFAYCNKGGVLSKTVYRAATKCAKAGGRGAYIVTFNRSIRACALIGAPGVPVEGVPYSYEVRTSWQAGDDKSVHVSTSNSAGQDDAHGFFLAVHC